MKKMQKSHFIPVLTTEAGRCLTVENWQEVGVSMVTYDLSALLMKPGFELLSTLPELASYVGWPGDVTLNASMLNIDKNGGFTLRSEYDGSRRRFSLDDMLGLIAQLKPQRVLLPEGVQDAWQSLPNAVVPFFTPADLPHGADQSYGVYFLYDKTTQFSLLAEHIQKHKNIPCYVGGELSAALIDELADLGVQYIASDVPARDACHGLIYSQGNVISLSDDVFRLDFRVIDDACHCPTCKQQLTRAYLHHLLEHTPLLCQRFLIQHNVYLCTVGSFDG